MGDLTRDMILKAEDAKLERVEVPEWGGAVYVRTMTAADRDVWELQTGEHRQAMVDEHGEDAPAHVLMQNLRARYVVFCACDASGAPLFTADDVEALGAKASGPVSRIFQVAKDLNGLGDDDVDELAGKSEAAAG